LIYEAVYELLIGTKIGDLEGLNDLEPRNGGMAFILRYPTEFGSHVKLCLGLGFGAFWSWSLS